MSQDRAAEIARARKNAWREGWEAASAAQSRPDVSPAAMEGFVAAAREEGGRAEAAKAEQLIEALSVDLSREQDRAAKLQTALLKAFTVVEWVTGEGYALPEPHFDADDLLLELVPLLGVEDSTAARKALKP